MISITVPDRALLNLRISPHALWDVMASAALLVRHRHAPAFPYRNWMRIVMRSVSAGRGSALLRWVAQWPPGEVPTFLLPVPTRGVMDLEEACDGLRANPADAVRERLRQRYPGELPPAFRPIAADPVATMDKLAEAAHEYARTVLASCWSAVIDSIADEVSFRAHALVSGGVDEMLGGLHTRIGWTRPTLALETGDDGPHPTELSGITLVPLLFARDRVLLTTMPDGAVGLGYQARGAANLAMTLGAHSGSSNDRLGQLLGKTRSTVLRSLETPRTTTALAGELGLAPSTVSEHLGVLVSCRMAVRVRRANRVYYGLSDAALSLLRSFNGAESDG